MEQDPFRGLVKPLHGKEHKGKFRKVSGRYRIIFKPVYASKSSRCSPFFCATRGRTGRPAGV